MAYFKNLPNILYPSLRNGKKSSHDYTLIKNLFKYAKIPDGLLDIYVAFEDYQIIGDDRPDNVAEKYYNNSGLDWIILVTNNIQNVREDWPMPQKILYNHLYEKYTEAELEQVKYYETIEVKNSKNHIILKSGIKVPQNFTIRYVDDNVVEETNPVNAITNLEYEIQKNDEKRSILLLRREYVPILEKDLRSIFQYTRSSEFVDEKTIRVESPCIL